jgi:hypothetical protein
MLIASAPLAPSPDSNVELVLISAGVVLVTALVAFVPIQLARVRQHRQREAIVAVVLLWGLLTAGSISSFVMKQMDWSSTYLQRIETGYYDPQNVSDKPAAPVPLWGGLAAVYTAIVLWSTRGK